MFKIISLITAISIFAVPIRAEPLEELQPVELTVLMYHFIVENRGEHHISPCEFERDLRWLRKNGYTTIGMSDLTAFVYDNQPLPDKPVMLTFDDGYWNNYVHAFPLLKKYGSKAVISIIGDHTDLWSSNFYDDIEFGHLTWTQINEMLESNLVEIGNHTYSMHNNRGARRGSTRMNGECLLEFQRLFGRDVQRLQSRVIEETGHSPDSFAFPFHAVCDDAIHVLRILGFRAVFTGAGSSNTITPNDINCLFDLRRENRSRLRPAERILGS
jgi:peptidoglycan/xylan/chitin deacetylase (PgdA/CDA1 family)